MRGLFSRRSATGQTHEGEESSPVNTAKASGSGARYIDDAGDIKGMSLEALVRVGSGSADKENAGVSSSRPVVYGSSSNGGGGRDGGGGGGGGIPMDFGFHSMALQIKDAERSLHFYQEILGMQLVKHSDSDDYSMYFLTFPSSSKGEDDTLFGRRKGMLQLIHVHGTEHDDAFKVFTAGPGFTHFSVSVPDVDKARQRMESMGVTIVEDGSNARGFAAIADPDGYNVQLVSQSEGQDDRLREQLAQLINDVPSQMQLRLPSGVGERRGSSSVERNPAAFGKASKTAEQSSTTTMTTTEATDLLRRLEREQQERIEKLQRARGGSPVSPLAASPPT